MYSQKDPNGIPRHMVVHATYFTLNEMLGMIDEENASGCSAMVDDNYSIFFDAKGASHNHQAWPGGYIDHIVDAMNNGIKEYQHDTFLRPGSLQFSLSDLLLIIFLHDLEKPWKQYATAMGAPELLEQFSTEEGKHQFRMDKIAEYGIKLTEYQLNALMHIEGEKGLYSPNKRVQNELAAYCHICDVKGARVWHQYPLAQDDPWCGDTGRANPLSKQTS